MIGFLKTHRIFSLSAALLLVIGFIVYKNYSNLGGFNTYNSNLLSFEYPSTLQAKTLETSSIITRIGLIPKIPRPWYNPELQITEAKNTSKYAATEDLYHYTLQSAALEVFTFKGASSTITVGGEHAIETKIELPTSPTYKYDVYILHAGYLYHIDFTTPVAQDKQNKPVLEHILSTLKFNS